MNVIANHFPSEAIPMAGIAAPTGRLRARNDRHFWIPAHAFVVSGMTNYIILLMIFSAFFGNSAFQLLMRLKKSGIASARKYASQ